MQSLHVHTKFFFFLACTPSRVSQSYSVCNWPEILPQGLVFGDYISMYTYESNAIRQKVRENERFAGCINVGMS